MTDIDYTQLCRVCLRSESEFTGHLLPIEKTRIHLSTISLLEAMKLFISIELNKDERIPQRICTSCVKDITSGYVFKLKCEAAERFLMKEILNVVLPSSSGRKKDKCVSTADLPQGTIEENEALLEEAVQQPQPEPQEEPQQHRIAVVERQSQGPCKLESEIIEAARAQNVIQSYSGYINPHQYTPPPPPQANYFEVVQNHMTGQNEFSYNVPEYSSYVPQYTDPYDARYSHNEDHHMHDSHYVSKIEIEDHQLVENMDDIIEHDEYGTEYEDPDYDDYNEQHIDKETADAVKAISKSPRKATKKTVKSKIRRKPGRKPKNPGQIRAIVFNTLNCISCEETFENTESLRKHFIESHTHGQFCTFCNKAILSSMHRHVSAHFKGDNIQCPKCDKLCSTELALLQHCTKNHSTFECPECHLKLNNQEEFNAHIAEHQKSSERALASNGVEYEAKRICETCNEIFDNQAAVKAHFLSEHIDIDYCKVCDLRMPLKNVKVHVTDHFRREKFLCEKCKRRFNQNISLKQHEVEQHNGHGICQYCLLEMDTKEEFDNHIIDHELAGTVGCYMCRKCGLACSSFTALVNHQTAHEEERYKCKDCRHAFKKEFEYKKHLAIGHKMKCKPYCKMCVVII